MQLLKQIMYFLHLMHSSERSYCYLYSQEYIDSTNIKFMHEYYRNMSTKIAQHASSFQVTWHIALRHLSEILMNSKCNMDTSICHFLLSWHWPNYFSALCHTVHSLWKFKKVKLAELWTLKVLVSWKTQACLWINSNF